MSWSADATLLRPGCIVQIQNPRSSTGHPTHPHFFIVVRRPRPLKIGDYIRLIGVSSSIPLGRIDFRRHVPMKWLARPGGDPETGFTRRCHATVDFTHVLEVKMGEHFTLEVEAKYNGKFIRSDKLHTITAAYNVLHPQIQADQ